MVDKATFASNAETLARTVLAAAVDPRHGHDTLMIDMEDATVTEATLDVYWELHDQGLPVAITIQSYLHRTRRDLDKLIGSGAWVRLVKGAFAEPASVAVRSRADRNSNFRTCAAMLLSRAAQESGVYPSFATHDPRAIAEIATQADAHGWDRESYEFEMLYGVAPDLQRSLVSRGHRVRLYLPFGEDWFPYAIRRVGEAPRNLRFLARALAHS
jgi:proline dehydrogenase